MPLKENLWRDTVAHLDRKGALTAGPNATVREAIGLMRGHRSGCLFVVEDDRLVGIFTERDLLKRVLGPGVDLGARISTVMTAQPELAREDERVGEVLEKMRDGGYRHLPIVDARGRVTGRLSVREIVHYVVEHFPKAVYNLPPRPDQVPIAPEGA